jgi:putative transcriptional regulator
MIRFRIQELIAEKHFREGRRVTLLDLSKATGISRVTLSKMVNQIGYSTVTDNLDKLCIFFNCKLSDLAEHVPEDKSAIEASEPPR